MMTASLETPGHTRHPVLRGIGELRSVLAAVRDVPVALMSAEEKAEALVALSQIGDLVSSFRLEVMAAADDLAREEGARDAGAWLAHATRTDPGPCHRDLRLAQALTSRWTRLGTAFRAGEVNAGQASVIARSLDALPAAELPESVLLDAEERLIGFAAELAPQQLRIVGRRILDVVAPEVGEAREARLLEAEERRAAERMALSIHRNGDGSSRIIATVPDVVAERLRTYLEAFTSPRHDARAGGEGDRIPAERKRGQAFCALLETVDPRRLPQHGGDATTLVVTVTLDALRSELATAGILGEDLQLSAGQVRRLACTARVIPAVLGGESEVLDLGRGSRLYSAAQRKALRIRDRRCRAEGCTVNGTWCEAHHRKSWSQGGATDLADGVLLCGFHHHRAHDDRYVATDLPNGDIRFRRRT